MSDQPVVHVVDDDRAIRDVLQFICRSAGLRVVLYPDAQAFLDAYDPEQPGCLLLDVRMPGMSGLDLQKALAESHNALPVIILTGHGDVPMARRALKQGAFDFLEKPFDEDALLACLQRAIAADAEMRPRVAARRRIARRMSRLTKAERAVLDGIVAGKTNKEMAAELYAAESTIEKRRKRMMEKMGANDLSELVQMVYALREAPLVDASLYQRSALSP